MQTATDFIKEELDRLGLLDKGQVMTNIFEKAKQLEKQQIIDAYAQGRFDYEDFSKGIKQNVRQSKEYFAETYGSKGSDDHIGEANEMIDKTDGNSLEKVPNVTSSQAEISDIDKKIKSIYDEYSLVEVDSSLISKTFYNGIEKGYKKCLEDMSQTEISDEEIEKEGINRGWIYDDSESYEIGWVEGIKWYREQLKKK